MTNSQFKKKQAKLFDTRRAKKLAYEMDRQLLPAPKTAPKERISKQSVLAAIELASSVGDINNDY